MKLQLFRGVKSQSLPLRQIDYNPLFLQRVFSFKRIVFARYTLWIRLVYFCWNIIHFRSSFLPIPLVAPCLLANEAYSLCKGFFRRAAFSARILAKTEYSALREKEH